MPGKTCYHHGPAGVLQVNKRRGRHPFAGLADDLDDELSGRG
ncbi:hypothetical protein [Sphingomonas psychrotolerans]|nr:hypothetical protein [Sphingomonas psychrotolerans]